MTQTPMKELAIANSPLKVINVHVLKALEQIFRDMDLMYGKSWSSQVSDSKTYGDLLMAWCKQLSFFDAKLILEAYRHCTTEYYDYPPTCYQLKNMCWELSKLIPSLDDAIKKAAARDFGNAIVKDLHGKIGEWDMKTQSAEYIRKIATPLYRVIVREFKVDPEGFMKGNVKESK